MELSSSSSVEIGVPLDLRWVSHGTSGVAWRKEDTRLVWWGMGDCSRSNKRDLDMISSWFLIHWTISHSFGDLSVILALWGCSWVLSGVASRNQGSLHVWLGTWNCSACIAGNCASSLPWGKSHCFSRVAAGTWDKFSSYSGDGHSNLMLVQRRQDSCLVMMDISLI